MENPKFPLHLCHVHKLSNFINRTHILVHSIALAFLFYYRASFFFQHPNTKATTLPWLLVFASEILLAFEWLLSQSFRWRTVLRTVFPERLPENDKLPAIDVLICTADPEKEPTVMVMNTVLSATMAIDYPPEKLHVYLSDDGCAAVTLNGMREAWRFAKWWLPFCRRYGIKCTAPEAYFSAGGEGDGHEEDGDSGGSEFVHEKEHIKEAYEVFKRSVTENARIEDARSNMRRDHSAVIEVIQETSSEGDDAIKTNEAKDMPLLVYVSREKRPSHPHHFKAGALNVLLRVSGVISNSPYILGLDCDMYCNDASSARQAMCFHLDPKISPSLAFVQFPHKFHNISINDIYDSQLRSIFTLQWQGYDGLGGPCVCGGYYIKRVALCGCSISEDGDAMKLRQCFGPSKQFIKSLRQINKPDHMFIPRNNAQLNESPRLASCAYEDRTKWGKEANHNNPAQELVSYTVQWWKITSQGFICIAKVGFQCFVIQKGHNSWVAAPPNWMSFWSKGQDGSSGLVDVAISKFSPLIYGPFKTHTFLQSMCYAEIALLPIFYFLTLWCFAIIPQVCLLNSIPLYPEVSNTYFILFSFVFLSLLSKHLYEVLATGSTFRHWVNEQRIWMMKSVTSHLYGSVDAFMKKLGMREASFLPTNKVDDVEQLKLYNMGVFDFQTSLQFLAPMVALVILNMASFAVGIAKGIFVGELDKMFIQIFIAFYVIVMNYPIIEGMLIRKDKGSIPLSVTLLSALFSFIVYFFGSIIFM
ncbi:hypothetical protein EV2_013104 [Malus domestica]